MRCCHTSEMYFSFLCMLTLHLINSHLLPQCKTGIAKVVYMMHSWAFEFTVLLSWRRIFGLCAKARSLPVWSQSTLCQQSCKWCSEGQFSLPSLSPISPSHFIFACRIRKLVLSENVPDKTTQLLIRSPVWLAAWVPARARGGSREPGIILLAAPHAQDVLGDGRVEESSQAWALLVVDSTGLPPLVLFSGLVFTVRCWRCFLLHDIYQDAIQWSLIRSISLLHAIQVFNNTSCFELLLTHTHIHTYSHTLNISLILIISKLEHCTDCMAKSVQRV